MGCVYGLLIRGKVPAVASCVPNSSKTFKRTVAQPNCLAHVVHMTIDLAGLEKLVEDILISDLANNFDTIQ